MRRAIGLIALSVAGFVIVLGAGRAAPDARAASPRDPARALRAPPTGKATPSPTPTFRTRTGPGLKTGTGKDAVSWRAVRGFILLAIALGVIGWLFRVRVRDWMLGRSDRDRTLE
jgi:hypothetical protein